MSADFVAHMEDVLDLYAEPYDPARPVVCFDESSIQLLADSRPSLPAAPGRPRRQDYEYVRAGTRNLFLACEPKAGWRHVAITQRRTMQDFAHQMRWLVDQAYPDVPVVRVVLDNLNTHRTASLYETFPPAEARRIAQQLEFHYTPKHGSWLNMAEMEFSVLARACLRGRHSDVDSLEKAVNANVSERNAAAAPVNWRFTTMKARAKLRRLYPDTTNLTDYYTAADPEGSTVPRWILGGSDAGDFTITDTSEETGRTTADLTFRNPPDFDRPADSNRDNEYLVTIRPYDGRVYGSYEVTITVTSDNEPPVITGSNARTFRENGTGAIYTYRATDPEGDDFTWSVGGLDASRFEISDQGVLTFTNPPDFESPPRPDDNDYQVTVQARDDQGGTGEFDVIVTVTDQDEAPEIAGTSSNTAITVQENHDAVLATYTATDPEDPTADITRWSVTGRDGGDFTINEDGELTFRNDPDHERPADSNRDNIYEVTVRASDGRYYGTLDVVVTVNAVNEAPEFRSNSTVEFTYQENATSALYTYRATDPEGGDITWRLSGDDSSAFEISDTGVLIFASPPDYESPTDSGSNNVYQVTVEARDADDSTAQIARLQVTVTVTNVTD